MWIVFSICVAGSASSSKLYMTWFTALSNSSCLRAQPKFLVRPLNRIRSKHWSFLRLGMGCFLFDRSFSNKSGCGFCSKICIMLQIFAFREWLTVAWFSSYTFDTFFSAVVNFFHAFRASSSTSSSTSCSPVSIVTTGGVEALVLVKCNFVAAIIFKKWHDSI